MLMTRRKRKERREVGVYLNKKLLRQVKTMKYLGIIIDKKTNIQRAYNTGDRKMSEINIHFRKISKIKLGLKSQSFKNTLHGRNTAAPSIRNTGLGRHSRKGAIQENANWYTKANKHKDSKSLQNGGKRSIVCNHRNKTHSHQNIRNGGILPNSQRKQLYEPTNRS